MKNQRVVIVGGATGLGLTIAKLMLADGAESIALIDKNGPLLAETVGSLKRQGHDVTGVEGDITRRETAHASFRQALDELGRVDSLINSAAIYPRRPILEISDEDWDLENAVNIKGTYHMTVAAIAHMRSRPRVEANVAGRIVNITSVDAFKAHPQNAHYAATKAAVVSLTRSFAQEVAKDGILVNSVAPAGFATEKAKTAGFLGELAAANPLGRAAEPEEIAQWVVMMASARNTYTTGENVIVSGGYIYA
jgi:3-oxoacyl-[acyl-carrier protein] reductase